MSTSQSTTHTQISDSSQINRPSFICTYPNCGKSFRYRSEIERHESTHTNTRPYACNYPGCSKAFKREDALKNHMRTHTQEKIYVCRYPNCGESFTTQASMRYHELKHNTEKMYYCDYPGCNKGFYTKSQLKKHIRSPNVHKNLVNFIEEDQLDESSFGIQSFETQSTESEIVNGHQVEGTQQGTFKQAMPFKKQKSACQQKSIPQGCGHGTCNQGGHVSEDRAFIEERQQLLLPQLRLLEQENEHLRNRMEFYQKLMEIKGIHTQFLNLDTVEDNVKQNIFQQSQEQILPNNNHNHNNNSTTEHQTLLDIDLESLPDNIFVLSQ